MPHSSGGGSHSGGSHGGSHHSSYHSSSSHSSGSGSSSTPRVSKEYFSGAHRYVYYQGHRPVYYYSKKPVDASNWRHTVIFSSVFLVIWILFCLWVYSDDLFPPKKLPMNYKDTSLVVSDQASLLSDEEKEDLYAVFREFQNTTGITPAFLTVNNEDWEKNYYYLDDYAYDAYVNAFDDESHWLIVYSEPKNLDPSFLNWYWEGMQGDDTDHIITTEKANQLTASVQKYLTRKSYTVGNAVAQSFRDILPGIMRLQVNGDTVFAFLFMTIPAGIMVYRIIAAVRSKNRSKAVRCESDQGQVLEDKCDYCGGIYVHGLHESCPHCGAPIPKAEETKG